MIRIRSKIEELFTVDFPNFGTSVKIKAIRPDTLDKLISGITDTRDHALVLLLIDTGLRVKELIALDKDSITYESAGLPDGSIGISGTGQLFCAKSQTERPFYLSARTVVALNVYLKERGEDGLTALFVDKKGMRFNSGALVQMMHGWCDRIGIERIGPHQLRLHITSRANRGGGSGATAAQLMKFGGWSEFRASCPRATADVSA